MAGPSKYETHVEPKLMLVECWARDGYIDEDIAEKLGISYSTFSVYKNEFSEFSEALKKGKEVVDYQVENALLKRALGYKYEEITEEESDLGSKTKRVIKEVAPDVTAQIYWLNNRKPKEWRNRRNEDQKEQGSAKSFEDEFKDVIFK